MGQQHPLLVKTKHTPELDSLPFFFPRAFCPDASRAAVEKFDSNVLTFANKNTPQIHYNNLELTDFLKCICLHIYQHQLLSFSVLLTKKQLWRAKWYCPLGGSTAPQTAAGLFSWLPRNVCWWCRNSVKPCFWGQLVSRCEVFCDCNAVAALLKGKPTHHLW